jgi:hypothetical protein
LQVAVRVASIENGQTFATLALLKPLQRTPDAPEALYL